MTNDKKKVSLAIDSTKALIDKSRNRPYLPELYLRLAELYIEKSRIVYFLRKAEVSYSLKSLDHLQSNTLKNQALEIYQRILNDFPDFEDRDKVHFFMAHEYRELAQIDEMVKQYRIIIKTYKKSNYASEAYLLLGDHFFNNGDLDMAQRHYEAVSRYPGSSAESIARYKLGWCYINRADCGKAMGLFEASVTSASTVKSDDVDTYSRVDIKLESLIDMAYCYGEVYKKSTPKETINYFKKFAWSRPVYTTVLEKTANRFLLKKKWSKAAAIYRHLGSVQEDGEKLLEYGENIFEAVRSLGSFQDADKDVALIIKALKKRRYSAHIPTEEKNKTVKKFELYARDMVTHLHQEAKKKKGGKAAQRLAYERAADAYKGYLDFFEETPIHTQMASNHAEALFASGRYLEAGKAYEKVLSSMPENSKKREDKLYGAVLSYYKTLKNKDGLNYFETAYARGGLKSRGGTFIEEYPKSKHTSNVLFNVAWVAYDEGRDDDAIKEFSRFAKRYPDKKDARAAVHLILDIYHKREDYEGLVKYGNDIIKSKVAANRKFRKEIGKIVLAAESKIISSLTVTALNDWDQGRSDISDFVARHESSPLGEQALHALLVTSKEKGDYKSLFEAGNQLVSRYPDSSRAEDGLGVMIDFSLKTAQFRLLASYLESFAKIRPSHANTAGFLHQAGRIRENLGQYDLSNRNYKQALTKKGKAQKEKTLFIMAENAEQTGNLDSAIKILGSSRKGISRIGKAKVSALLSSYYYQKGSLKKANKYRKSARKSYSKKIAKKDEQINRFMARMEFAALEKTTRRYMGINLDKGIDNKIVAAKTKLLEGLEKSYLTVIRYESPKWALASIYQTYKINREFGRFLKDAPLPELTPEQKSQYVAAVNEQANNYLKKAEQYQTAAIDQAHKWEVTDPELINFYIPSSETELVSRGTFFDVADIAEQDDSILYDENNREIYERLIKKPKDLQSLFDLAMAYAANADYRQTILVTRKALDESKGNKTVLRASLYNLLGLSFLYTGDDDLAKDAFRKAIDNDSENVGAKNNLAALLRHYGHEAKAREIIASLPDLRASIDDRGRKTKELYYAEK